MNNVAIVGRIVDEPRLMNSDGSVIRLKVACDRRYVNKETGKREADFIPVVAFNNTAKFVVQYFHKGDCIGVTGHIQTGSYEKDGCRVYTTDVYAEQVEFVGYKRQNAEGDGTKEFMDVPDGGIDEEVPFN